LLLEQTDLSATQTHQPTPSHQRNSAACNSTTAPDSDHTRRSIRRILPPWSVSWPTMQSSVRHGQSPQECGIVASTSSIPGAYCTAHPAEHGNHAPQASDLSMMNDPTFLHRNHTLDCLPSTRTDPRVA